MEKLIKLMKEMSWDEYMLLIHYIQNTDCVDGEYFTSRKPIVEFFFKLRYETDCSDS